MGELRDRMEGDLLLRPVAATTRSEYLRCARHLAAYYRRSPAELGADEVRAYLLHRTRDLGYRPANLKIHIAALKFLYTVTLRRPDLVEQIPYPKVPRPLLDIPSPGEVARVLGTMSSLKYRMVLFCAYGAGLRVPEACNLCVGDIDSTRMVIHVRAGKGGRDRYAMLSPVLRDSLHQYCAAVQLLPEPLLPDLPGSPPSTSASRRARRRGCCSSPQRARSSHRPGRRVPT